MDKKLVSYETAVGLAWLHNEAVDARKSAEDMIEDPNKFLPGLSDLLSIEYVNTELFPDDLEVARNTESHTASLIPNFRTDVQKPNIDRAADEASRRRDVLKPDDELKESLMRDFELSYKTYSSIVNAMNENRKAHTECVLPLATIEQTRSAIDQLLTPGLVYDAIMQIIKTNAKRLKGPYYDIVLVPNVDLDTNDETAAFEYVGALIRNSSIHRRKKDGPYGPYCNPTFHNSDTTNKADSTVDNPVKAVLMPRNPNVASSTIEGQRSAITRYNEDDSKQSTMNTGIDMVAVTYIAMMLRAGNMHSTRGSFTYSGDRFKYSSFRDVMAEPYNGCVPSVYVEESGGLYRDYSTSEFNYPTRAHLTPKN